MKHVGWNILCAQYTCVLTLLGIRLPGDNSDIREHHAKKLPIPSWSSNKASWSFVLQIQSLQMLSVDYLRKFALISIWYLLRSSYKNNYELDLAHCKDLDDLREIRHSIHCGSKTSRCSLDYIGLPLKGDRLVRSLKQLLQETEARSWQIKSLSGKTAKGDKLAWAKINSHGGASLILTCHWIVMAVLQ